MQFTKLQLAINVILWKFKDYIEDILLKKSAY